MTDSKKKLFELACKTRENSYSPYSHHKVGAAILTEDGRMFGGCNIENSSYGATICAERVAIHQALAEDPKTRIKEVMVVTDATPAWPPCGLCRQVLSEFAEPHTLVHTANLKKEITSFKFSDLLPQAFTPGHLIKA